MMTVNTLSKTKDKIPEIIEKQKTACLDYKDFIENVIKTDEPYIKDLYNSILPNNSDFERLISSACKNIETVPAIIKQYDDILCSIQQDNQISENYLKLVYNTLTQSRVMQELPNDLKNVKLWYNQVKKDDINFQNKTSFISILHNLLEKTETLEHTEYLLLAQIYAFKYFSNPDKNFIIIGTNGSGKSSFARNSKKVLDRNVAIIAAQKIFTLTKISSVSLGKTSRENLWSYQTEDKLYKDSNFIRKVESDLQNVFTSLVEEHNARANEYFEKSKEDIGVEREKTILENVIVVWNEILVHRCLSYSDGQLNVSVPYSSTKYDFMKLSDGEKAIFYYIAHVLLAKRDSFIIVDEPENHLNLALVTRLWDRLEKERKDCRFIYLTHNLDFATSRIDAEKLWMKEFSPPAQWTIEKLPTDEELPEILYMELLGSQKQILFCEGTKSSLDYKLYTRLFPNYTVVPVGGHLQVINYTRAFNKSVGIHGNTAIGIIDGDFHTTCQKEVWRNDFIYCVDAQEVENILCDEDLLKACYKHFYATDEKFEEAKNILFKRLSQNIDTQTIEYATQTINEYLKANLLEKVDSHEKLKSNLKKLLNDSSNLIDELIRKRKTELDDIIARKDYELGVRKYNYKGLVGIVPVVIEKDYKDKIFIFLDEHQEVLTMLRNKYFSDITS